MSRRDPYIIKQINFRRVVVVTAVSLLVVLLILFSYIMESGLPLTLKSLAQIHAEHPSLYLIDLIPVFISALLHPMHRIMNRAIREYEERVIASQQLRKRNTEFAQVLSDGEDPEPYDEMMETDLGKALRMIHINIKADRRKESEQGWITEGKDIVLKRPLNMLREIKLLMLKAEGP